MLFQQAVHVSFETTFQAPKFVRTVFHVGRHVTDHIRFNVCRVTAVVALEVLGPVDVMRTKVAFQITEIVGAVVAVRAVLVLLPTLVMDFRVLPKFAVGVECCVALLTLERLVWIPLVTSCDVNFKLCCSRC
jgi:hypothetical protein